uniref:NADH dehydrogenase subunit 5 n=1 Tax=Euglena gracilis var. bacillaris TaxID=158060 RepID=A0A0S2YRR8_EUGGR|nr:NADH dehydrogenase subunit 5 [Euglena gracilis var. bacillaris]
MNNNLQIENYTNKNKIVISPISYIGNNHPYKMYTIINLCISSSLLITNYTIAKTSIFLYLIYIFNNNIYFIIIMLFFVLYPIIFIVLIHPFIIISVNNHLINKANNKGIIINNFIIMLILVLSPIISWYVLYNIIIINIYNNKLIYLLSYNFINYYNYNIDLEIGISIYEMITVILLINVSYMINIYILKYLYKDKNVIRFVCIIMLFTYNMILLIISNDLIMNFIGWEMIGIISLLLISLRKYNTMSIYKFNNNNYNVFFIGLLGLGVILYLIVFYIGLLDLLLSSGSLDIMLHDTYFVVGHFLTVLSLVDLININILYYNSSLAILLLIFINICYWSKSTQLGFQPWLLDAMEGPTPVSALLVFYPMHLAGLYISPFIVFGHPEVYVIAGIILLYNILISYMYYNINNLDIKRIVAYSTCTHISLMIIIRSTLPILFVIINISLLIILVEGSIRGIIGLIIIGMSFIICAWSKSTQLGFYVNYLLSQGYSLGINLFIILINNKIDINRIEATKAGFTGLLLSSGSLDIMLLGCLLYTSHKQFLV